MEDIQKAHMATMGKMDAAMMEKMKPMKDKMEQVAHENVPAVIWEIIL